MIEIERKFLVKKAEFLKDLSGTRFKQGYLSTDSNRAVRVRAAGDRAFLTIKGKSSASGLSRYEWEKEIGITEADELLKLCLPTPIEKTRYIIPHRGSNWEVDIFHGANSGLILAEIELLDEDQIFEKPIWLGTEVTNDHRYYNAYLSEHPLLEW